MNDPLDGFFIVGYLAESGRFYKAAEVAATQRNRDLIADRKLIPLREASVPASIASKDAPTEGNK